MFYRRWILGSLFGLFLVTVAASRVQAADAGAAVAEKPTAKQTQATETALDRYLANGDDTYHWKLLETVDGDGYTTYVIDMVSQTWRTTADVDRPVWKHWLIIVKPDEVKYDKAMLFIDGGSNKGGPPSKADDLATALAVGTHSVVADLKMIPNQPLIFHNDGKERVEDDLIGYTWAQFLKTGDETWPARLPMVKAAVRAMDTVQTFMKEKQAGEIDIKKFVVAGGSKRGWTTWLTGAVDDRVTAIIPIVIDVLNMEKSMQHHHDAYGFWATAVWDYVRHDLMDKAGTPEYDALMTISDPYRYRNRLTMPKYIVNAANDQFFLPDSSQFYYDELLGEKRLRYNPNVGHSLSGSTALQDIETYYHAILEGTPRPEYAWTFEDDGSIRVTTKQKPLKVLLWQATNKRARDFRLEVVGRESYVSSPLEPDADGAYVARVEVPKKGFTAFFVELTFESGFAHPFVFTTSVRVLPDVLPHEGEPLAPKKLHLRSRRKKKHGK